MMASDIRHRHRPRVVRRRLEQEVKGGRVTESERRELQRLLTEYRNSLRYLCVMASITLLLVLIDLGRGFF